jgi:N-glycosylase/DNA lyase
LGTSAKSIKREIKEFFPESDFPTILRGAVDVRIIEVVHFFSNYTVIHPVLDSTKISKAANGLLQTCGLRNADQELVDGI